MSSAHVARRRVVFDFTQPSIEAFSLFFSNKKEKENNVKKERKRTIKRQTKNQLQEKEKKSN